MKLRSLIVRLIVLWIPLLPPTPLIARVHQKVSTTENPLNLVGTAKGCLGPDISRLKGDLVIPNSKIGGMKCAEF